MITDITPLKQSELFGALCADELSMVAPLCSTVSVFQEGILFSEGRTASHLYLVTDGQIALQKAVRVPHGRRSRRTTLALCAPGEVVGWSALLEPYKHTVLATAWDSSRLIRVDARPMRDAMESHPETGYKIMAALSDTVSRRLARLADTVANERERSVFGGDERPAGPPADLV
jgi:CRP-like cAMP-binding protein